VTQPRGAVLLLNFNVDERQMYDDALVAAGYEVTTCVGPFDALRRGGGHRSRDARDVAAAARVAAARTQNPSVAA
jgi:hypothetical protein